MPSSFEIVYKKLIRLIKKKCNGLDSVAYFQSTKISGTSKFKSFLSKNTLPYNGSMAYKRIKFHATQRW